MDTANFQHLGEPEDSPVVGISTEGQVTLYLLEHGGCENMQSARPVW